MMKVFNKGIRTFLLVSTENSLVKMKLEPGKFYEIPADFQGDPTLKMALAADEVQQYNTITQADAIEKAAKATPDEALEVGKRTRKTAKE